MPSNINYDATLLNEALKIERHKYKKDAINAVLKEYVEKHKRLQILDLFGTIEYNDDNNYKSGRNRS